MPVKEKNKLRKNQVSFSFALKLLDYMWSNTCRRYILSDLFFLDRRVFDQIRGCTVVLVPMCLHSVANTK